MEPIVLVHGGAGDIPDNRNQGKIDGVLLAVQEGYKALLESNSVLDAVEAAVNSMEKDDYFNAGYGSVLTLNGTVEMDASIMTGDLNGGCVSIVKDIMHPISLARRVMEKTVHTFLAGDGVMDFAREQGVEILEPGQLVTEYAKEALNEFIENQKKGGTKFARTEIGEDKSSKKAYGEVGTVGAVAIDADGNIAVATSTGGITGKLPGRVGDTPILGSGTYCDNRFGGVSTTGHGETIMRYNLAHEILKRIQFQNKTAQEATSEALTEMTALLEGTAGAITIGSSGEVGIYFTSQKMAWAYRKGDCVHYGINKDEDVAICDNKMNSP